MKTKASLLVAVASSRTTGFFLLLSIMAAGREASGVVQLAVMSWHGRVLIKYVTEHEHMAIFTRPSS
jgi:hypothetical protein